LAAACKPTVVRVAQSRIDPPLTAAADGSRRSVHLLASPHIEVDDDTATGEWTNSAKIDRQDVRNLFL
jgi:hypothetical protein